MPETKDLSPSMSAKDRRLVAKSTRDFAYVAIIAGLFFVDAFSVQLMTGFKVPKVSVVVLVIVGLLVFSSLTWTMLTNYALVSKRLEFHDTPWNLFFNSLGETLWFTLFYSAFAALLLVKLDIPMLRCDSQAFAAYLQAFSDRLVKSVSLDLFDISGASITTCLHIASDWRPVAVMIIYHLLVSLLILPFLVAAARRTMPDINVKGLTRTRDEPEGASTTSIDRAKAAPHDGDRDA